MKDKLRFWGVVVFIGAIASAGTFAILKLANRLVFEPFKANTHEKPGANGLKVGHFTTKIKSYDLQDPQTWLDVVELWKCEDGTFEVKVKNTSRGKFTTKEEADAVRNAWVQECIERTREMKFEAQRTVLTNCGERLP